MAEEDQLKTWMKDKNVWHPKLYKVLKEKKISTLGQFGKLKKTEYNAIVKESKFAKPSTLKSVYDNAKPKKKKKKTKKTDDTDSKESEKDNATSSQKKKKGKSGAKTKSKGSQRKSVKEMMAEYAKQKPKGSGKTNDTVSFVGDVSIDDD